MGQEQIIPDLNTLIAMLTARGALYRHDPATDMFYMKRLDAGGRYSERPLGVGVRRAIATLEKEEAETQRKALEAADKRWEQSEAAAQGQTA